MPPWRRTEIETEHRNLNFKWSEDHLQPEDTIDIGDLKVLLEVKSPAERVARDALAAAIAQELATA